MELHKRLFGKDVLGHRTMIEISGPSNSGKTLLAQQLLAYYLCELKWDILFVNLSHKVQVHSFAKWIRSYGTISTEEDLKERLHSVKLINCFTSKEFDEALEIMKYTLLANRNIKLIVLDTLSEFFWPEMEHRMVKISKVKYYANYIQSLETICKDGNVCALWTVNNTFLDATGASSSKIHYKLQLNILHDGEIQLNGQPVELNSEGVHFINAKSSKDNANG